MEQDWIKDRKLKVRTIRSNEYFDCLKFFSGWRRGKKVITSEQSLRTAPKDATSSAAGWRGNLRKEEFGII